MDWTYVEKLEERIKKLVESHDNLLKALRTIRDDKSFDGKLAREIARLSLLENAKSNIEELKQSVLR